MKRKLLLAIIVVLAISLSPIAVLAGNTVTVNDQPYFSAGITSFTVTYVSDTEMDLAWTVDATVANVMVRAKYGQYPANIPNPNTQPSDGYLVYYGSGLSAVDTSMDMNQNAGTLYYEAWAQKGDGTWYLVPSTVPEESREVVLIALILLGALGSFFGIVKRQWLFSIGASVVWFFLIAYTRSNPLPNVVAGSSVDSLWIGICVLFSLGTMLTTFILSNNDKKQELEKFHNSQGYRPEQEINRHNAIGSSYESADDYQARLAAISKKKR
jgi:hypothetical protein